MPTDPDDAGLLRAVCADPHSDLPRLVYADYIEERGQDERAALIRREVANPSLGRYKLLPHCFGFPVQLEFRRGFAEGVRLGQIAFTGLACRRCHRTGSATHDEGGDPCQNCDGVGGAGGMARELFESSPLTRVALSNVAVVQSRVSPGRWTFDAQYGHLPVALTTLLIEEEADSAGTREEAASRAEAACVEWGRSLVGLPPLTVT